MGRPSIGLLFVCAAALACDDDPVEPPPPAATTFEVELSGLPALDTTSMGPFELWLVGSGGELESLARFPVVEDPQRMVVAGALEDPVAAMVTLEPRSDTLPGPSSLKVMGGGFRGGAAELALVGYVTPNLELEPRPGQHVLNTFWEDGPPGLPSRDDAGIWLHNPLPVADTLDGSYYVDLTPLTAGWIYEGWVVRDWGEEAEVWLSYGKFLPDNTRQVSDRDETGLGPYAGREDWERALPFLAFVPGDDFLGNAGGYPQPQGVSFPVDLNGCGPCGEPSRWTHVITIEPWADRFEEPWNAAPFFLRPYRNAIGDADPEVGRDVILHAGELPSGMVVVRP